MYGSTSKGELAASKAADWWLMALVTATASEMPSVQVAAATSTFKTTITETLLLTTSRESATWTRPSRLKKLFEFLKTPSQALPSADPSDGSSRTASPLKPNVVNEAPQTEEHKKREAVDGASPTRSENPSKKVVQPTVQQGSLQPIASGTLPRNEGLVLGQTQLHNLQGLSFPGAADCSRSVEQEPHEHDSSRTDTKAVSNDAVSHVTTTLLAPALSSNSQSPSSALADSSVPISPDEMIHMRKSEPVAAVENAIITSTASTRTHSQSFEANASSVIEVPFNLSAFEKLDKTRYMALRETISEDLAWRWATEVKPRLDEDLQKLIRTISSGTDQILSNTRFYMVGTRHGEILRAVPTIVVSCGTKRSKNRVKKELCRLKLHYLNDFGQPIIIRYQCSPTYWATSSVEEASSTAGNSKSSALRCVWIESGPQLSGCGLKLMFEVQYGTVLERKYATLGGMVRINGRYYGLTSPHSWLANISVSDNSQTGTQDDEKTSSGSQSDSEVDDDMQRSPYGSQYLQFSPSASMNFEPFWSPSMQAPKAHSFLGQVVRIDGTVCYDSSRCDWALFTLPRTYILPNTYYDTKDGASSSVAPTEIQSVSKESELTPGSVSILSDARMPVIGFLTQTNVSFHTRDCVMDVREIALNSPLAGGASGSWVVRDDKLYGYIVAVAGTGMSGFMMPMQRTFKDIETTFGHKVKVGKDLVDFSPQVSADIAPAHQKFSEGIDIQKLTLAPPRLADFAELDHSRWLTMEKGTKTAIRDRSSSPEAQRANLPIAAAPRGASRAQEHAPEKTEISATINTENTKLGRAIPQAKTNDVPSQPNELPWTWRRPHFAGYNLTRATEDASRKRTVSAYSKPAGVGPVVSPKISPSQLQTLGPVDEDGEMQPDIPQEPTGRPVARLFMPLPTPYARYDNVTQPRGETISDLRNNRHVAKRRGWTRVLLIALIVLLIIAGLAVGLGVGLTRSKGSPSSPTTASSPGPTSSTSSTTRPTAATTSGAGHITVPQSHNSGPIAGGITGGLVAILLVVGLFVYLQRLQKRNERSKMAPIVPRELGHWK